MTISEQLDKFVERGADDAFDSAIDFGNSAICQTYFFAGANSLKPIVLKLYEACKDYEHMGVPSNGSSLSRHSSAAEALAQVEQMIGGGK